MAEVIASGHTAEMGEGEKSQYDVWIDERLVFSKQQTGRWPELVEILAELPPA